jgi:hypothetical protein
MDTLRQLAGDVSEFLTSRTDMVRNTPLLPPAWQGLRDKVASGEITTQDYLAAIRSDPTIQREMFDTALNNPFFGPLVSGIKAFHGSPHDFDKFDLSKIGTGEGAQAYGHGLYFAENPQVAQLYRDHLAKSTLDFGGQRVAPAELSELLWKRSGNNSPEFLRGVMDAVHEMTATGNVPTAPADLARWIGYGPMPQREGYAFAAGELKKAKTSAGRMYEVDINTTPDRLLDWDKPVSEQPLAIKAANAVLEPAMLEGGWMPKAVSDIVRPSSYMSRYKSEELPQVLRNVGVDGVRYLDAGSRGAGDGSRNLVIFDADLINILRKYGILAPLMGAGAVEAVSGAPEQ